MDGFKELRGATRAAVAALCAHMVLDLLAALLRVAYPPGAAGNPALYPPEQVGTPADLAALPAFLALLLSFVLVGRWIYRASANAHALSTDLTITPGWAVGWYFVPFANLAMPFQAMKEVWRESHEAAGRHEESESPLLGWWWGLWIATNVLGNLSMALGGRSPEALEGAVYVDLIAAAINVPLCLILIRMMRQLTDTQNVARHATAFA